MREAPGAVDAVKVSTLGNKPRERPARIVCPGSRRTQHKGAKFTVSEGVACRDEHAQALQSPREPVNQRHTTG